METKMKIISAIIIALFIAVPAIAADTFEVITGDNEVSSIEQVEVAITYSPGQAGTYSSTGITVTP